MAKVYGPLHSDAARGEYGGKKTGVVYSNWNRVAYIRRAALDISNPRTVRQTRNRAILRCLNALWARLDDPEKVAWTAYGRSLGLPGFQAYCKYNLLQAQEGWMPQLQVNEEHLGQPTAPTNLAATVVDNSILATWTDDTLSNTSALHLAVSAGFTAAMSNLVYATPATDGEDRQATIKVAPGTYYMKARSGDEDGGEGAATIAVGPIVIA